MSQLYFDQKDIDAAYDIAEKALQLGLNNSTLFDIQGNCLLQKGDTNGAIQKFQACLEGTDENPFAPDALLGLSMAYFDQSDLKKAKKYFNRAVKAEPLLGQGIDGLPSLEAKGYSFSESKKEYLKKMLEQLK
ncbi:MAG: tetratricopeptide repeat protein [Lewinellaceae bacterium]|nr:tetratricopeptide repeat protein [Lewinellaceae bacterium]